MRALLLCLVMVFAMDCFAEETESKGTDKGWYAGLEAGKTTQTASSGIDISFGSGPEVEYKDGSAMLISGGYGYDVLHVEGIYARLGDQGFEYGTFLIISEKSVS